jgi:hypothetical protein
MQVLVIGAAALAVAVAVAGVAGPDDPCQALALEVDERAGVFVLKAHEREREGFSERRRLKFCGATPRMVKERPLILAKPASRSLSRGTTC